jgi:uncharacterized protein YutE (UPF0331/DUF86 family)
MSPRDLDPDVIQIRLRLLRELLDDLAGAGAIDKDRLDRDRILRHAVERILSQVVELAVAINSHVSAALLGRAPETYRDSFRLAVTAGLLDTDLARRLEPSVGLRNILAHEYVAVDLGLVATAAESALADYGAYVAAVRDWLRQRTD